jgi:molybdate transport system substrate-binding protein
MTYRSLACSLAFLLALTGFCSRAESAEIRVLSSAAVKEAYVELAPVFEKSTGHKLSTVWDGTANILKRLRAGEMFDLVIIPPADIDRLIAEAKLASGSRTDFVKSGIGIAVRAGMPKPDVASGEAVKNAVLAAKSVAYSSGPSGNYIAGLFQKMGIAEQIKGKVTQTPSGVQVGEVVARGDADLGFQQVSELLHVKGIEFLGPLPSDIQHITVFSAGIHAASKEQDAARALIKFLTSPEAAPSIRKAGLEPG